MTQYKTVTEGEWAKYIYAHVGPSADAKNAVFMR
jgi:hypothetical protein